MTSTAPDPKEWEIDVAARRARHRVSGMVLEVVAHNGDNFSVQPLPWSLPNVQGSIDAGQRAALEALIAQRVQEGGTLLVQAVAKSLPA